MSDSTKVPVPPVRIITIEISFVVCCIYCICHILIMDDSTSEVCVRVHLGSVDGRKYGDRLFKLFHFQLNTSGELIDYEILIREGFFATENLGELVITVIRHKKYGVNYFEQSEIEGIIEDVLGKEHPYEISAADTTMQKFDLNFNKKAFMVFYRVTPLDSKEEMVEFLKTRKVDL